jgi:hypothetical protein
MSWNTGFLKLHVLKAHLEINHGGMMNKMDPFVVMKAGPMQEWRSPVCHNGGKNPEWGLQHNFDVDVCHLGQELEIWVKDAKAAQGSHLGHAKLRLEAFKRAEVAEERVAIF